MRYVDIHIQGVPFYFCQLHILISLRKNVSDKSVWLEGGHKMVSLV